MAGLEPFDELGATALLQVVNQLFEVPGQLGGGITLGGGRRLQIQQIDVFEPCLQLSVVRNGRQQPLVHRRQLSVGKGRPLADLLDQGQIETRHGKHRQPACTGLGIPRDITRMAAAAAGVESAHAHRTTVFRGDMATRATGRCGLGLIGKVLAQM